MGFSVSGSAVIVFVGVVVAAGVAVPPVLGSIGDLAGAQGEQIDRGTETLNTDVAIESAVYNGTADEFTLNATNAGSTTLSVNKTSLLLDGTIQTRSGGEITDTAIGGTNSDATLWLPGETLEITVATGTEPDRVKLVTGNGVERTTGDVETVS
jgi:flagellar protein FlaF